MRLYLASWLEDGQGVSLTKIGAKRRLLSYHFIKESRLPEFVPNYIQNGIYIRPKDMEKLPKPQKRISIPRIKRNLKIYTLPIESIKPDLTSIFEVQTGTISQDNIVIKEEKEIKQILNDIMFSINMASDCLNDCKEKLESLLKGE